MWCPFLAGSYFGPSMFRNRVLKSPPPLAQSCVVPTPCARAAGALTRESGKPRVTRYSAASAPSGSRLYGISSRARAIPSHSLAARLSLIAFTVAGSLWNFLSNARR